MCYKNVNATLFTCKAYEEENDNVTSFSNLFDSIIPSKDSDDNYYIENINVILNATFLFDEVIEDDLDSFKINCLYEFSVRIFHDDTKVSALLWKQEKAFKKEELVSSYKDYCELNCIIKIPRMVVPKLGDYAVVLLIREKGDEDANKWQTQTVHRLIIGDVR